MQASQQASKHASAAGFAAGLAAGIIGTGFSAVGAESVGIAIRTPLGFFGGTAVLFL